MATRDHHPITDDSKMATIPAEALATLRRSEIDARSVKLPHQLARSDYVTVAKACATLGGKWSKSTKRIEFPAGTDAIRAALANDNGEHVDPQKELGFFPTPGALAYRMCIAAHITGDMLCLEPSAGVGHIAREMESRAGWVDCVELHPPHVAELRDWRELTNPNMTVLEADFLTLPHDPIYDRIVMNPPFSAPCMASADAVHIMHAWQFLKPGGRLVSIASSGVTFRENHSSRRLRDLVSARGSITPLPSGTFKPSGTDVETCMVTLHKPA